MLFAVASPNALRAADLPKQPVPVVLDVRAPAVVPAARNSSIFVFGGALSTSNMGSTLIFNAAPLGSDSLSPPLYDNYIVGAAYQYKLWDAGWGLVFGAEIGVADRFGEYKVCCDNLIVKSSSMVHSGELWGGPVLRVELPVLFGHVRIIPAIAVGFSYTTNSIGAERGREIAGPASGRFLGYLGPELNFSSPDLPNWELVVRLHHRSGAGGLFGAMHEGYNANVVGVRHWF